MADLNQIREHVLNISAASNSQQFYFWKHCIYLNKKGGLKDGFLLGFYQSNEVIWHELVARVLSNLHDRQANDLYRNTQNIHLEYGALRITESLWGLWRSALTAEGKDCRSRVEDFISAVLLVQISGGDAWGDIVDRIGKAKSLVVSAFEVQLEQEYWINSAEFGQKALADDWLGSVEFNKDFTQTSFWLALAMIEAAWGQNEDDQAGTVTLGSFSLPSPRPEAMPAPGSSLRKLALHMAASSPVWRELLLRLFKFEFQAPPAPKEPAPITSIQGQDLFIALIGSRQVGKTSLLRTLSRAGDRVLIHRDGNRIASDELPLLPTQVSHEVELRSPEIGNPRIRCADVAGEDILDESGKPRHALGQALKNRPPAGAILILDPTEPERQKNVLSLINQWDMVPGQLGKFPVPFVILINKADLWKPGKNQWVAGITKDETLGIPRHFSPELLAKDFAGIERDSSLSMQPGIVTALREVMELFGGELSTLLKNNPHARLGFSVASDQHDGTVKDTWRYLETAAIESSKTARGEWKAGLLRTLDLQVRYLESLHQLSDHLRGENNSSVLAWPKNLGIEEQADCANSLFWLLHTIAEFSNGADAGPALLQKVTSWKGFLLEEAEFQRLRTAPELVEADPRWAMNSLLDHLLEDLGTIPNQGVLAARGGTGPYPSDGGTISEGDAWKPLSGCSRARCAFIDNSQRFAVGAIPAVWTAGESPHQFVLDRIGSPSDLELSLGYLTNQRAADPKSVNLLRFPQFALKKGSTDIAHIEALKIVFPKDERKTWSVKLLTAIRDFATSGAKLRPAHVLAAQYYLSRGATFRSKNFFTEIFEGSPRRIASDGLAALKLEDPETDYLENPSTQVSFVTKRVAMADALKEYSERMINHLARAYAEYLSHAGWIPTGKLFRKEMLNHGETTHFPKLDALYDFDTCKAILVEGLDNGQIKYSSIRQMIDELSVS